MTDTVDETPTDRPSPSEDYVGPPPRDYPPRMSTTEAIRLARAALPGDDTDGSPVTIPAGAVRALLPSWSGVAGLGVVLALTYGLGRRMAR